ncbi:MAG: D-alanyl-D-alanine carboxypeptidase/D-alanyl-D-alanine-endopeptidase [Betaproteobacteria bacterium]|nr:D-alanyl-D-alanine carboxypeptidase/D-alanyl-D-alanine-endopeptidase [Betaproteobacteria bacterium]
MIRFRRLALAAALLLALSPPLALARGLPKPVAQALRDAAVPASAVAIVVQEVGAARPSLSLNAGAPMNPASTMKLFTTLAALELLGPAYRWKTEAYAAGALRDGVLDGDLVLKGYGDPKLDYESFWMLLRALRGKGLREIRGDVVLDRSHFAPVAGDAGDFDGEALRPYNVLPDALLVHYKAVRFAFVPQADGAGVRIYVEPRPPALEVTNNLRLAAGDCVEGRAFRNLISPTFEPGPPPRVAFNGRYPIACGEKDLNVALLPPDEHVAGMLRQLWAEMGGSWIGRTREGTVPEGARLLHTHESPPLAEIVRDINKFSNNVMARQLFITLATAGNNPPAQLHQAQQMLRHWLNIEGIAAPELVIENGSGLSRTDRASAATLAALLQAAWKSAVMPEYIASLPLAALDGTMRKRLHGELVAGQAHIKTGLLSDARTMAGYVLDAKGRRQIVVMLMNHPNAPDAEAANDALLRWVYERK